MGDYRFVHFEKKDHMAKVSLVRPIEDQIELARLSDELSELCTEMMLDESVRVVMLTGPEKSFIIDRACVPCSSKMGVGRKWSLSEPIERLAPPVIVAVHGDAIAQGLELILACDIRIAADSSHFGVPHIKSGLIPWDGGTQRLPRLIGRTKALEMILMGETVDAQEAYRIGLVQKVVPSEELMGVAIKTAREMATQGPIALRYAKEAIYKGMDLTLEQGLRLEADLYLLLHTTRDRTEGIQAFQERRDPEFENR